MEINEEQELELKWDLSTKSPVFQVLKINKETSKVEVMPVN